MMQQHLVAQKEQLTAALPLFLFWTSCKKWHFQLNRCMQLPVFTMCHKSIFSQVPVLLG